MVYGNDNIHDAMQKIAAPRQIKIIRELIRKGERKKAEALIKKLQSAGVLKTTGPGTNVQRLGSGAEGVADLVVGAKGSKGRAVVRKTFDRGGPVYSKGMMSEKAQAGRKLRNTEEPFAKLISNKVGKGKTGGRYLLYEEAQAAKGIREKLLAIRRRGSKELPQTALIRVEKGRATTFGKAKDYLKKNKERGGGRQLMDIKNNPGNTVKGKVIDYLPAKTRDVASAHRMVERAHPGELFGQRALPKSLQSSAERAAVARNSSALGKNLGVTQRSAAKNWVGAPAKNVGRNVPTDSQFMAGARQQGALFERMYKVPQSVGKRYQGMRAGDMSFASASPRRALSGLGRGSRQAKKIRGQK